MRSIGYRHLYDSDNPDALILAILCDFQGESARDVIEHILTKLQTLTGHNEKMRREYLQMLEILADNRHLNIDIQETYDMLQINIENLPSYRLAMGKGLEKGLEKGIEKATRLIALKLLRKGTPVSTIAEVTGLTEAEIQQMASDNMPQ